MNRFTVAIPTPHHDGDVDEPLPLDVIGKLRNSSRGQGLFRGFYCVSWLHGKTITN
ncbi:MAG: hypothetical protein Q9M26_00975 [Mariprofundales bacterium]|nr:hypothetical protein [Mariprofundales bacterium]